MSRFFPFGPPPIANLTRRVKLQKQAYEEAVRDLNDAREAQDFEPEPLDEDEPTSLSDKILQAHRRASGPSQSEPPSFDPPRAIYVSEHARRMHADAERRRRGLGPDEYNARITARQIIDADRKARGDK